MHGPAKFLASKSGRATCYSAAGDGGDDRDFRVGRERSGKAAGVADVFIADEEIDVFADLALFGENAVANAGVEGVKGGQGIGESGGRLLNLDYAATAGKFAQSAWDVKRYGHG